MKNYGLHVGIPNKSGIIRDTPLTSIAFFLGPPQGWRCSTWNEKAVNKFVTSLQNCPNLSSDKTVVHGCYLINPASIKEEVKVKSRKRFLEEIKLCDELNIKNYVFHPGVNKDTQKGLQETVDLIKVGLQETKNVNILVENMTKTNTLCQTWQEVEWVIKNVNDPRIGNCLDTAHCWGAGSKKGMFMDTLLDDYDRIVGIENLKVIHLNDSKVEYGSNKDRHEDILKGKIPKDFWSSFIKDKRVETVPTILETPTNCRSVVTDIINGMNPEDFSEVNNKNNDFHDERKDELPKENVYDELWGIFPEEWKQKFPNEFEKPYFTNLVQKLNEDNQNKLNIFPPIDKIFKVFEVCKPENIKVVICGQDPYHKKGQAEGFSFSVPENVRVPSSLKNIYKELSKDLENYQIPKHGHLAKWVEQGVFLLNSSLTVVEGKPSSHIKEWLPFTKRVLQYINDNCEKVVFILWGNFAKKLCGFVDKDKHCVLTSAHPSGLSASRGFYGCKHFSKCNTYLKENGIPEIDWGV